MREIRSETELLRPRLKFLIVLLSVSACGGQPPIANSELLVSTLYETNWEVAILNLDDSVLFRITRDPSMDIDPVWSPDGKEILVSSTRRSQDSADDRNGDEELFVLNQQGSVVRQLTNNLFQDTQPDWSPDGNWISFKSDRTGRPEIFIMRSDGTEVRQLTNNAAEDWSPDWSPDGRSLVFASDRNGNFDIFVMRADGSELSQVTDSPQIDWYPNWSPDGETVAFASNRYGNFDIFLVRADGSELRQVTDSPVNELEPIWSPTGDALAFTEAGSGDFRILVLDLDSGQVTDTGLRGIPADWRNARLADN